MNQNKMFNALIAELELLSQELPSGEPPFKAIAVYENDYSLPHLAEITSGSDKGIFKTEETLVALKEVNSEQVNECSDIWEAINDHEFTENEIATHFEKQAEAQAEDDRWMAWERQQLDSFTFPWGGYSGGF
jgi:hypothetical protein